MVFVTVQIEIDFNKALESGAIEFQSIIEKPWKKKVSYVRDNNGFLIEICTPVKTISQQDDLALGDILAERELKYVNSDGEQSLFIKLGKPRPDQKLGGDWECAFQIGDKIKLAYGVDSFQALLLAQKLISADINYLNKAKKLNLTWLGMRELGF